MKPESFGEARTGKVIAVDGPGVSHAFLPDDLPPDWPWPEDLWPILLEAHKALATLDGTGKHLPNPELLLRPLQNREAQKSSSLEGTITDPHEQMLFELDPDLPQASKDRLNAFREVANYGRALRMHRLRGDSLPLSLRLIKDLHEELLAGVRGSDQNPGHFRRTQNQIGRPARFVPPPPQHLPGLLDSFEKYLHAERRYDPLVEAFLAHYQFEAIHPFMDGNGRVGRLLLSLTVEDWCGLSNQWLYMSAYFDRNKDEYIDRLFRVSTHGAWSDWIAFCLAGVIEQSLDTLRRCDRLITAHRRFHDVISEAGGSVRLSSIVDDLFVQPVLAVTTVRDKFGVTYPTARSDLKSLETLGLVTLVPEAEKITYYAPEIFAIVYFDDGT